MKKSGWMAFVLFMITGSYAGASAESLIPCLDNPKLQIERAKELQTILEADQNDERKAMAEHPEAPLVQKNLEEMAKRDLSRRKRVAEIFAEGCLKTARDYAAASLVFQHGNVPDHYLQAFLWARRAVDLGDASQKAMVAMTIDRYLVNLGHKQLFATQFGKAVGESCLCMEPVEESFPDSQRLKYQKNSLAEQLAWLKKKNEGAKCPSSYCRREFKGSPSGTVPGFW